MCCQTDIPSKLKRISIKLQKLYLRQIQSLVEEVTPKFCRSAVLSIVSSTVSGKTLPLAHQVFLDCIILGSVVPPPTPHLDKSEATALLKPGSHL